jgi:hypothetical protein
VTPAKRLILFGVFCFCAFPVFAQNGKESRVGSDFRRERAQLSSCRKFDFGSLSSCGQTLFTGQPIHIAVGSLAPQNGVGFGLAFIEHKNFVNEWRLNWNVDAVGTGNGSWRAGAYMKAFRLPGGRIVPVNPAPAVGTTPSKARQSQPFYRAAPLFNVYAESTSLNHIDYFGLGPDTTPAGKSAFGFTEPIIGAGAILPFAGPANVSLLGELNGRFPSVRGNHETKLRSIEQQYTEATAPGLARQPAYFQAGEGFRLRPSLFRDFLRLNYLFNFQQFVATDAHYSFRRWTADLGHEFPLYHNVRLVAARDQNGPDSCSAGPSTPDCPHISLSQNLEGSIGVRLLMVGSVANAGSVVPFYFDPTIGGSDVNGQPLLASFPDYRFRGPNVLLLRGTFEHSLWKLPAGFLFSVDEGRIGLRRDDIAFEHLRHTYTTGLTLHAGGLPVVYLLFAFGGGEGNHTTVSISNALLGGSPRPSLF